MFSRVRISRTVAGLFFLFILSVPLLVWAQFFAIVADSHVGARDSLYAEIMRGIDSENAQAVIHLGDAIQTPGSARQWKRFFELTGSGKTIHVTPGNHDISNERSLEVFLRFFPKTYYSFTEGDTIFVFLNTELPGQRRRITGDQLAWLARELDRPFRYKFVFLHQPLFPIVRLHGLDVHEEARDRLHRLFAEKKVSLVVSGHDHVYNRTLRDGVVYVISPRSRSVSGLFLNDGEPGYILADRKGGGYSFWVKNAEGKITDNFVIHR